MSDRQGEGDGNLEKRLRHLEAELGRAEQAARPRPERAAADGRGMGQALRLASEFIAGILVGAGLGWLVDWIFNTSPWGLIVLLMAGFAAGVLNVIRVAGAPTGSGPPTS
ncbi:MAG: AtpZ/AtpI family protein [Bauldia sp.]